ncbi:MAG: hypothetical protein ACYTCU_11225 [Planctomycetota bacterium]
MAKSDDKTIPVCSMCEVRMEPKRTSIISGPGQRPRMLIVNYACPECRSKTSIEREEYDLRTAEDAVWKDGR